MNAATRQTIAACALVAVAGCAGDGIGAQERIRTTEHPPLPGHRAHYWMVPEAAPARATAARTESALAAFARGAKLLADGEFAAALPLVSNAEIAATPLANYRHYYRGVGFT